MDLECLRGLLPIQVIPVHISYFARILVQGQMAIGFRYGAPMLLRSEKRWKWFFAMHLDTMVSMDFELAGWTIEKSLFPHAHEPMRISVADLFGLLTSIAY